MKKTIAILLLLVLSGCFVTERTGYIDYRERRMYDWDPIYYTPGFYDPFFYGPYYRQPIILYRPAPNPRPQQPRRYNLTPNNPPSRPNIGGSNAPIRKFPDKKDDK